MRFNFSSNILRTVAVSTESTVADPTEGMTPEQRLHWKILHRHKEGVEADIDEIINRDTKLQRVLRATRSRRPHPQHRPASRHERSR